MKEFAGLIVEGVKWFFDSELKFFLTMLALVGLVTYLGM